MKNIFKLSLPLMVATVINIFGTIIDMIIVGNLGVKAISSVSAGGTVFTVFAQIILVLLVGFQVLGSQAFSKEDLKEVNKYFFNNLFIMYTVASIVLVISIVNIDILISFFSTEEIRDDSKLYFISRILGLLFIPLAMSLKTSYDIRRNSKVGLYYAIVVLIFDIIFSIIFTVFIKLGVFGAGLGTLIGLIAGIVYISIINLKSGIIRFTKENFKLDKTSLTELRNINFPEVINMLLDYLGTAVIASMITYLDIYGIASNRIIGMYITIIFGLSMNISLATQILLNTEENKDKHKNIVWDTVKLVVLIFLPISIAMLSMPNLFIKIFTDNEMLIQHLHNSIVLLGAFLILIPGVAITSSILRAYKKSKINMYINVFSVWGIQVIFVYILLFYFKFGTSSIILGYFFYFLVRLIMNTIYIKENNSGKID